MTTTLASPAALHSSGAFFSTPEGQAVRNARIEIDFAQRQFDLLQERSTWLLTRLVAARGSAVESQLIAQFDQAAAENERQYRRVEHLQKLRLDAIATAQKAVTA